MSFGLTYVNIILCRSLYVGTQMNKFKMNLNACLKHLISVISILFNVC